MSHSLHHLKSLLQDAARNTKPAQGTFFKTGPGHYAEHDQFIGVSVPVLRKIAKDFVSLALADIQTLLESKINEERLLALIILVHHYQKASEPRQEDLYNFYMKNRSHVNNWNLVDASAHLIVGAHLRPRDKSILWELVQSQVLWERRIAMVSTWHFIRHEELDWTFRLAEQLLQDTHDLMHKATGWMLREAGKKDQRQLMAFLDKHASHMPRTMLRYAIEKFPEPQRKEYLSKKPFSI